MGIETLLVLSGRYEVNRVFASGITETEKTPA